jgi:hypothetical protein
MGLGVSVREPSLVVGAGLLLASVAVWTALVAMGDEMPMGFGLWIGAWTVMMAAPRASTSSPGSRRPASPVAATPRTSSSPTGAVEE